MLYICKHILLEQMNIKIKEMTKEPSLSLLSFRKDAALKRDENKGHLLVVRGEVCYNGMEET